MTLKAPPDPIRIFVVMDESDKAVVKVIITASEMISIDPIIPELPTTHGCLMYIITPNMVKVVGVKTPANVPNVLGVLVTCNFPDFTFNFFI